tara:strand:+ start:1659 stop:3587 length:1929 start_codon:yes stop_codon:yes gene_type:complete
MPFTKFSNLDFDQIKTSIKDYLRANSDFTDFDYEGSNFSVLIDTLAYNTYITAFNANMVVNESFLDSAVLRENVVSLARNIGYVPRSRTAARAQVYFPVYIDATTYSTTSLTLKAGLVCVASSADEAFTFAISEDITTTVNNGIANFGSISDPITVYQGTYITQSFQVDGSLDQRFLLENAFIDSSTIVVYVKGPSDPGMGKQYSLVDNIVGVNKDSETYLIQEIQDQKYELLFGDGVFGKKLEDGTEITVGYIISDGKAGNGPSQFTYAGTIRDTLDNIIPPQSLPIVSTTAPAANGGEIESIDSVKYFAPRLYSAQHRAVTGRDYEAIIQKVYPNTESVSVVGGEELDPPQFGTVLITIKPKNGEYVSDFDKQLILADLKNYSLAGINQKIVDLKLLYVELDSYVYYDTAKVSSVDRLKTRITEGLTTYSDSTEINKFGGRFKYSKALNIIDKIDNAITSNITRVKIRRNLKAILNSFAQYELCFGNKFNINAQGRNIKSTGFKIEGELDTVYITDIPNKDANGNLDGSGKGVLSIVKLNVNVDEATVVVKSAGTVDYDKGEVMLTTTNITSTIAKNNIVEIQAFPDSNDVVGLKDLYLDFSISDTTINMVKDTITSGEKISGVGFKATSSYSNGDLIRT